MGGSPNLGDQGADVLVHHNSPGTDTLVTSTTALPPLSGHLTGKPLNPSPHPVREVLTSPKRGKRAHLRSRS